MLHLFHPSVNKFYCPSPVDTFSIHKFLHSKYKSVLVGTPGFNDKTNYILQETKFNANLNLSFFSEYKKKLEYMAHQQELPTTLFFNLPLVGSSTL